MFEEIPLNTGVGALSPRVDCRNVVKKKNDVNCKNVCKCIRYIRKEKTIMVVAFQININIKITNNQQDKK